VERPRLITSASRSIVRSRVGAGAWHDEIWFRLPPVRCVDAGSALLAATLPAAMYEGRELHVCAPVSARLMTHVEPLQALLNSWDPRLKPVTVHAEGTTHARCDPPAAADRAVGCAFTGGVDSLYTVLRGRHRLGALVFVHGFDIALRNRTLRRHVARRLRAAAGSLGIPLLEVSTNLKTFSDRFVDWHLAFGGALAAVAMLLSDRFGEFLIAAGQCARFPLLPDGAHPELNPLYSTDRLQVRAAGLDATRFEKVLAIAHDPVAMNSLRVCWRNPGNAYNCGRCEKCLRTLVSLEIAGAAQDCTTFGEALDLERLAHTRFHHPDLVMFMRENLEAALAHGARPQLVRALRRCVSPRLRLQRRLTAQARRLAKRGASFLLSRLRRATT